MFFLFIFHVWLLGVMPIFGIFGTLYQPAFKLAMGSALPEWYGILIMIAAIPAIFYFLGYSFFLGQLYMDNSEPFFGKDKAKTMDYLLMVLGPFLYFAYIYFIRKADLLPAAAYTGIITIISQHLMLHMVSWIDHLKRIRQEHPQSRDVVRFIFLTFTLLLFLILGSGVLIGYFLVEKDLLSSVIMSLTLITSLSATFRFFWYKRENVYKVYAGEGE